MEFVEVMGCFLQANQILADRSWYDACVCSVLGDWARCCLHRAEFIQSETEHCCSISIAAVFHGRVLKMTAARWPATGDTTRMTAEMTTMSTVRYGIALGTGPLLDREMVEGVVKVVKYEQSYIYVQ